MIPNQYPVSRRMSWASKKSQTTKLFPCSVSLANVLPIISLANKIPQKCSFEYLKHIYQFCQDPLYTTIFIF